MKSSELQLRFEELCAGHVIGDLTAEEASELTALCQQLGTTPDASLDLLAAAVHADALAHSAETLPPHLAARLHQWANQTAGELPTATANETASETNIVRPQPSLWRRLAVHPMTGWVAAAAVLLISLMMNRETQIEKPAEIVETLPVTTDSFKTFAAALSAADMSDVMDGKGPFTVFAPTDEAFAKLPKGTVEAMLKPENKAMLHELISNHVVPGELPLAKVLEAHEGKTLHGSKLNVHFDDGRVKINHSNVVKADIHAPNSMIHVIDRVIMSERIQISEDSAIMMTIIRDDTGQFKDVKTLEDLNKIPGINITVVPVTPTNPAQVTKIQDLIGFIDGMEIKNER